MDQFRPEIGTGGSVPTTPRIKPVALGLISDPPTLVLVYEVRNNIHENSLLGEKLKRRKRKMPLRNFTDRSKVKEYTFSLTQRHPEYLADVLPVTVQKMLRVIQEVMKGVDIQEAVIKISQEYEIGVDEDLNKLTTDELDHKKAIMDEDFRKHLVKPGDPGYVYDKVVQFDGDKQEPSGWDEDSDNENGDNQDNNKKTDNDDNHDISKETDDGDIQDNYNENGNDGNPVNSLVPKDQAKGDCLVLNETPETKNTNESNNKIVMGYSDDVLKVKGIAEEINPMKIVIESKIKEVCPIPNTNPNSHTDTTPIISPDLNPIPPTLTESLRIIERDVELKKSFSDSEGLDQVVFEIETGNVDSDDDDFWT